MSKGSDLAFPSERTSGPIAYQTTQAFFVRAIRRARVPAGTLHDLRHSYGRALGLAGKPITVIQAQLGHTTLAMTAKYVRIDEARSAEAIGDFSVGVDPPGESG